MRVLITGIKGFTGRYLVAELTQAGHECLAFDADLTDAAATDMEVQKLQPEAIVHLAAISFIPNSTGSSVYATNVIGTENLLQAAERLAAPPARIILASTSHVYGQNAHPKETDCPDPFNHYGISKYAMEQLAKTYQDRLSIVVARPFTYTGRGQAAHYLLPKLVQHFRAKSPVIELGNVGLSRDFSDVRWIAKAYHALLTQPLVHRVYNLCSGQSVSFQAVLQHLVQISQHQPKIVTNPAFVRQQDVLLQQGDNARISQLTTAMPLAPIAIYDTLSWMLSE
ncbi:MAG: NAD-dependent epimerase/dehydratase family protein [Thiotrichales bacterium]|jgi:nucleoside-diphosphate-sugar epimerase|nr:NAD-dependent epimerase/dehydratase family protein [Thiotrichales bacterium]